MNESLLNQSFHTNNDTTTTTIQDILDQEDIQIQSQVTSSPVIINQNDIESFDEHKRLKKVKKLLNYRETKLRIVIKFMIGVTCVGIALFVITSSKMIYDFTTRWQDFYKCAPPIPKNVYNTGFVYIVEFIGLIGIIFSFNDQTLLKKKKKKKKKRKYYQAPLLHKP